MLTSCSRAKLEQPFDFRASTAEEGAYIDSSVPGSAGESRIVCEVLMEKHSEAQSLKMSAVTNENESTRVPDPILYEQINGPLIYSIALGTNGAAEPSVIDAAG